MRDKRQGNHLNKRALLITSPELRMRGDDVTEQTKDFKKKTKGKRIM